MIGKALLGLGLFVKINHISYYFKEPTGGMKAGRINDFVHTADGQNPALPIIRNIS